jgi:heme exporter protein B
MKVGRLNMPATPLPLAKAVWSVFYKEAMCELRTRYALSALLMFALVALSCISMAIGPVTLPPALTAALLWIVMFFCAMAGLARVFVQEQESGTLFTLRIYTPGQAVLLGKLLFNIMMLLALSAVIIPLFIIFFNVTIELWGSFGCILLLGDIGIAAAATLTAAMVIHAQGKSALFSVLTFPVLLPQFLSVITATAGILSGSDPDFSVMSFMFGYDVVIIAAASLLFDYIWYD